MTAQSESVLIGQAVGAPRRRMGRARLVARPLIVPLRSGTGGIISAPLWRGVAMATAKQRSAARRNIKRAAQKAKKKRTIAHLPKRVRTALGKEGAKAAKRKRNA
jgi:hypothetical protein